MATSQLGVSGNLGTLLTNDLDGDEIVAMFNFEGNLFTTDYNYTIDYFEFFVGASGTVLIVDPLEIDLLVPAPTFTGGSSVIGVPVTEIDLSVPIPNLLIGVAALVPTTEIDLSVPVAIIAATLTVPTTEIDLSIPSPVVNINNVISVDPLEIDLSVPVPTFIVDVSSAILEAFKEAFACGKPARYVVLASISDIVSGSIVPLSSCEVSFSDNSENYITANIPAATQYINPDAIGAFSTLKIWYGVRKPDDQLAIMLLASALINDISTSESPSNFTLTVKGHAFTGGLAGNAPAVLGQTAVTGVRNRTISNGKVSITCDVNTLVSYNQTILMPDSTSFLSEQVTFSFSPNDANLKISGT